MITVPTNVLSKIIEAVEKSAATGIIGDGKVFVMVLGEVKRVCTSATGMGAF